MQAGKLRHKIKLLTLTQDRDERGELVETWTEGRPIPAEVRQLAGRELLSRMEVQSQTTWQIRTRYREGIDSTARIRFGCKTFDVIAVTDPDQRRRELVIDCKETAIG